MVYLEHILSLLLDQNESNDPKCENLLDHLLNPVCQRELASTRSTNTLAGLVKVELVNLLQLPSD